MRDPGLARSRRTALSVTAGVNAALAWFGVVGLATGMIRLGEKLDDRLPWSSPVIGALALAVVVAIPLSWLAVAAWTGSRHTDDAATAAGALLIGWIVVQAVVLHAFSWFQPFYLVLGVVFVATGRRGRIPARLQGAATFGAGLVLSAVGVGLSPHLAGGRVVTAVAAVGLLVAGLAVTVLGARRLTAGWAWPWRVVGVLGAILALGTTGLLLAPPIAATTVPRPAIGRTPTDVDLDATSVTLVTPDGVELAGWWVPGTSAAALIVLHGAGSTRSDVLDEASVLADLGYGVLMVDARGHGDSGGTAMDFGWYGDEDIAAATDFLSDLDDVDADRIAVVGMSMGAEQAIGATATNPSIRAVVAEGATGRSADDKRWLSDVYGWRGQAQEGFEIAQHWFTDYLTETAPPTPLADAVRTSDATKFLLIAAGDVMDEQHVASRLEAIAPDRVDVWTVEGAGHTAGLETAHDEWVDRVLAFLDDALGGR